MVRFSFNINNLAKRSTGMLARAILYINGLDVSHDFLAHHVREIPSRKATRAPFCRNLYFLMAPGAARTGFGGLDFAVFGVGVRMQRAEQVLSIVGDQIPPY